MKKQLISKFKMYLTYLISEYFEAIHHAQQEVTNPEEVNNALNTDGISAELSFSVMEQCDIRMRKNCSYWADKIISSVALLLSVLCAIPAIRYFALLSSH